MHVGGCGRPTGMSGVADANANSCLHTLVGKPGGTRRRSLRGETWTLTSSVLDDRLSFHRGLSFFVLIVNAAAILP